MSSPKSLQERIVSEIESTYESIAAYKNRTFTNGASSYKKTAKQRVQLIEHKLKSLKMMLAKVDNGEFKRCEKCNQPILINRLIKKPQSSVCMKCAS
jgi:RNA polymerase-binding transcription factor DksA